MRRKILLRERFKSFCILSLYMDVYKPAEDSLLMLEAVKRHAKGNVLEIGTGTGILAIAAAKKKTVRKVIATDINIDALVHAENEAGRERRKIKFVESDLFEKVPEKKFDTIIFNPPYLPQDNEISDATIYGGKKGHELIARFLGECVPFLKAKGKIILLFSSLTKKDRVEKAILDNCMDFREIAEKNIFFETLYCHEITKSKLLSELERKGIKDVRKLAHGHRGIVYTAAYRGRKIAVKAKRKDSRAKGKIRNEAKWLKKLNKRGIGPKFIFEGKGYFSYEFVEGKFIADYVKENQKEEIIEALREVMRQCHVMDRMGISKEEMHHPRKHIIIKHKPVLIDFERCHETKKPQNVTQFLQFLSSRFFSSLLSKKGIRMEKRKAWRAARQYRKELNLNEVTSQFPWLSGK